MCWCALQRAQLEHFGVELTYFEIAFPDQAKKGFFGRLKPVRHKHDLWDAWIEREQA